MAIPEDAGYMDGDTKDDTVELKRPSILLSADCITSLIVLQVISQPYREGVSYCRACI